jgi:Mg2+ and Co2+ transporter CorA
MRAVTTAMSDDEQPEKVWDEYDWERFLQQQDRKTENYIDDPNRDQIIAREMGWYHLLDKDGEKWVEEVDSNFEEEIAQNGHLDDGDDDDDEAEDGADEDEGFEMHPLYQASFALTVWIDQLFDEVPELQNHAAAVRLSTQAAVASAKLAAALSDDDVDEIGMTIAYLKRALKAVSTSIEASVQMRRDVAMSAERTATLTQRLFQIRDGIIELMGEYRSEWRRRYDGH